MSKLLGNGRVLFEPADEAVEVMGVCCACGEHEAQHVIMLPFRAPLPKTGWGCLLCRLPLDGAVAVLCATCTESGADIKTVCVGWPAENERQPIDWTAAPFDHDMTKHPGEVFQ